jgi:hypothetical protein
MARPVKTRDVRTYTRDIEHINRLRMAIIMDGSIDSERAKEISDKIDSLTADLIALSKESAA